MSFAAAPHGTYEVRCPHCNREFRATVLGGAAARYSGFKCPHCKLFVPYERVEDEVRPLAAG